MTDGVSGCASAVASEAESAGRAARIGEKTPTSAATHPHPQIPVTHAAARVSCGRRRLSVVRRLAEQAQLSGVDMSAVHGRTH